MLGCHLVSEPRSLISAIAFEAINYFAGVAQAGKSFRNEIRTSNFLFRAREFDQWELQYFCAPPTSPATHDSWVAFSYDWLQSIGIRKENIRLHVYQKEVRLFCVSM